MLYVGFDSYVYKKSSYIKPTEGNRLRYKNFQASFFDCQMS